MGSSRIVRSSSITLPAKSSFGSANGSEALSFARRRNNSRRSRRTLIRLCTRCRAIGRSLVNRVRSLTAPCALKLRSTRLRTFHCTPISTTTIATRTAWVTTFSGSPGIGRTTR
jgi:hypothetical protein